MRANTSNAPTESSTVSSNSRVSREIRDLGDAGGMDACYRPRVDRARLPAGSIRLRPQDGGSPLRLLAGVEDAVPQRGGNVRQLVGRKPAGEQRSPGRHQSTNRG